MDLSEDLQRIAAAAGRFAGAGERLGGIVPAEPSPGERLYLCAYLRESEQATWLVLDDEGRPVEDRGLVRATVSIAALCELAEELAGGGDLDELRSRLVALRVSEDPPGIEQAEQAALALQETLGGPPRLATLQHLDAVGSATRRLEELLGGPGGSPFAAAMKQASETVAALTHDVEARYKRPLR
ncbi:MAG TPA: hypothetical protein VF002_08020 [Gaiellaceae bacterium]